MNSAINIIQERLNIAFEALGYDTEFAIVKKSDRPDLGDFQCSTAMKIAGVTKERAVDIANKIVASMSDESFFSNISVAGPGFINFTLNNPYIENALDSTRKNREGLESIGIEGQQKDVFHAPLSDANRRGLLYVNERPPQTSFPTDEGGVTPVFIQKNEGPAIISKQWSVEYDAIDFDRVKKLASTLADVIENKRDKLISILTKIESHETAIDEIEKSIDCLRHLDAEHESYAHLIGDTAVFMPLNLPLYSMVIFGIVPSFLSRHVSARYPGLMSEISRALWGELGIDSILPNLSIQNVGKEEFVDRFVTLADATIFTGKKENVDKIRKISRRDSVILFNGRGVNPVVIGPDADLQIAVDKALHVKIFNSGQDCAAADCMFVHESLSQEFIRALKAKLEAVVVGSYRDFSVRVGSLVEREQLRAASEYLYKHTDHVVLGGVVDFAKKIVRPSLVYYPEFGATNFKELFSPILHVVEYRDDKDLATYFESPQYRNNAMYASLFGKCDYLILEQKHTIVLQDQSVHDFERGYKEYGGYSQGASFVQMGREITAQPILASRELRRYAEWRRQPVPR